MISQPIHVKDADFTHAKIANEHILFSLKYGIYSYGRRTYEHNLLHNWDDYITDYSRKCDKCLLVCVTHAGFCKLCFENNKKNQIHIPIKTMTSQHAEIYQVGKWDIDFTITLQHNVSLDFYAPLIISIWYENIKNINDEFPLIIYKLWINRWQLIRLLFYEDICNEIFHVLIAREKQTQYVINE